MRVLRTAQNRPSIGRFRRIAQAPDAPPSLFFAHVAKAQHCADGCRYHSKNQRDDYR